MSLRYAAILAAAVVAGIALAQRGPAQAAAVPLEPAKLRLINVKAESVTFKGRPCLQLADPTKGDAPDGSQVAILSGAEFQDGVIEVDIAGDTLPGMGPAFRGFTGVAFRVAPSGASYEAFYLRPKNGRSADPEQRGHSAQYVSAPEFPWQRLRQETPGKYESYVDLVPGEWTQMRIEVQGDKARLFVHGSEQPTLMVNDLKHGQSKGAVALWIGPGTLAHFSSLRITRQ
jgi:hypothetical protein